jgi:hypothetical protein
LEKGKCREEREEDKSKRFWFLRRLRVLRTTFFSAKNLQALEFLSRAEILQMKFGLRWLDFLTRL